MKNNNTKIPNQNQVREEQQKITVFEVLEDIATIACIILFLFLGAFSNETEGITKDDATTEVTTKALKVARASSWASLFDTRSGGCFYITADGEKIYSRSYILKDPEDAIEHPILIWPEDSKAFEIHFSSDNLANKEVIVDKTGFYDYGYGTVYIEFVN